MRVPIIENFRDVELLLFTTLLVIIVVYLLTTSPQILASLKSMDAGGLKSSLIASGTFGMILALLGTIALIGTGMEWFDRGIGAFTKSIGKLPEYVSGKISDVASAASSVGKSSFSQSSEQPRSFAQSEYAQNM